MQSRPILGAIEPPPIMTMEVNGFFDGFRLAGHGSAA
jgi:hypothetical protein